MDPDSSSKFIGSLTKFLQSLCNGYVEFEDGVELIGHIYLSVDTGKKGKKIDYILNEKVCKSDNSVTFISNSFHALPDKAKRDESEVSDIGDGPPRSTNTGTVPSRLQPARSAPSPNQRSGVQIGSKRPGSPLKGPQSSQSRAHSPPSQRRLPSSAGRPPSGSPVSKTVPSSPSSSSQDNIPSPSPGKKGRSETVTSEPPSNQSDNADIEDIPSNVLSINPTPDFASFLGSLTSDNQSTHKSPRDTKPDTDVTFIKEEFVSEPSSCAQAGSSGRSGRTGEENGGGLYPVMLHQNTSVFPSTSAGYPPGFSSNASSTATSQSAFPGSSTSQSDMFNPVPGTSQDGADPSGSLACFTMVNPLSLSQNPDAYFAKGTPEHLLFLRVMREAHQLFPFTGKKDYTLIQQAMDEVLKQLPMLMTRRAQMENIFYTSTMSRIAKQRKKKQLTFKTVETSSSLLVKDYPSP